MSKKSSNRDTFEDRYFDFIRDEFLETKLTLKSQNAMLQSIKNQTTKTNGRVTALEKNVSNLNTKRSLGVDNRKLLGLTLVAVIFLLAIFAGLRGIPLPGVGV